MCRTPIIAVLLASLAGCALNINYPGIGPSFTDEQVQAVTPGMTVAEVTAMFGPPSSTVVSSSGTTMSWTYGAPAFISIAPYSTPQRIGPRTLVVTFVDGKVIGPTK